MGGQGSPATSAPAPRRGSPPALGLVAPARPFGGVREEAGRGAGLRGSLLSPKAACRGAAPGRRGGREEQPGQAAPARGRPHGAGGVRAALQGLRLFRPKSPNRRQGQPRS